MAKSRKSKLPPSRSGGIDLTTHRLVAKLHPEPDEPQDTVALLGYFGPSKKADHVRLYADLSFRRYFDIPTSGIVRTEPIVSEDENSPTAVFVLPATRLEVVETACQCMEASYLQGSIAATHLADASVEGMSSAANRGGPIALQPQTRQGWSVGIGCSIFADLCARRGGGGGGANPWPQLGYTCGPAGTICMSCVPSYPICRPL